MTTAAQISPKLGTPYTESWPWSLDHAALTLGWVGWLAGQADVGISFWNVHRFQGWRPGHWETFFCYYIRESRSTQPWTCSSGPSLENPALDSYFLGYCTLGTTAAFGQIHQKFNKSLWNVYFMPVTVVRPQGFLTLSGILRTCSPKLNREIGKIIASFSNYYEVMMFWVTWSGRSSLGRYV